MSLRQLPLALIVLLTATSCVVSVPVATQEPYTDDGRPVFTQGRGTRNPIIQSFTANPTNITQGQAITFHVAANDPDNQPLQFNWSATDGTLSTNAGQVVSWIPPTKPGTYTVMVTVSNGRGGFATGAQNLTVQPDGSTKIGTTPAASAAPTSPPASPLSSPSTTMPVLSPAPLVSPSAAIPSPAPSVSPSGSASSPQPSPSPVASGVLTLDKFTRQDVLLPLTMPRDLTKQPPAEYFGYAIKFRVSSASGASYAHCFSEVALENEGWSSYMGGTPSTTPMEFKNCAPGVYLLSFYQGAPTNPGKSFTLLTDGTRVKASFISAPSKMNRANWVIPPDAPAEFQIHQGAIYAFRYDGKGLDLGTFDLP